ncbi:triose-phosphate isomerase [Campylobacter ureolyticus]|uniref:triose-phosphate isomerase n=1 Tax=Campylobacter ureolyticus TaxID=827 RepID=UPI0004681467|nr:triose-phosphate isomerase [Campylobacter ureolyticus]QIX86747.1 triose-phosphate isomerase [Campylobacter ureolyticus]STA70953.1 triosephosphate isomerase [Campylobacter ureolyticus]
MIFAANLKCNHTRNSFLEYASVLNNFLKNRKSCENSDEIFVFPTSSAFLEGDFVFNQGAQNFYPVKNGSFTGEIGSEILDEFSIKTVLIGHSERRALGESNEFLKAKFEFAKKNGYKIIFCIGESDITYMNASTKSFLKSQLEGLDLEYENLNLAYEPIWAIGTGRSAKISEINEVLDFLRTFTDAPLLYGGSVNLNNISEILSVKNCDGVLVGSASLDVNNFINLINYKKG